MMPPAHDPEPLSAVVLRVLTLIHARREARRAAALCDGCDNPALPNDSLCAACRESVEREHAEVTL